MKKLIKIVSLAFACLMVFSVGCKSKSSTKDSSTSEDSTGGQFSSTYLVKNGVSPYKIVVPNDPSTELSFAANELQYFFSLSTGIELPIIEEKAISDTEGKYLSIGDTKIAKEAEVDLSEDVLGRDGYQLKTYGDAFVMAGANTRSSIFSVYGYLALQFNLEIYTDTLYTYDEVKTEKLIDVDITDIPDIPHRSGSTYLTGGGTASFQQLARYRIRGYNDGVGLWGHTHFMMLDPNKYAEAHPNWFNATRSQLAWENEEMWDAFVEAMKEWIDDNNDKRYFVMGFEDNYKLGHAAEDVIDPETGEYICGPTKYNALKAKYGNTDSSVYILFMNYVVRELNKYTAEKYPGREYIYAIYAYQQTINPPVVWSEKEKKYLPIAEEMLFEDNLAISMAFISEEINSAHSYFDEKWNSTTKKQVEGWMALTNKYFMWGYSTNFADYFAPFNSWGAYKENYMKYKEIGVLHLYEQGCLSIVPNYMELRQYLVSKLAWDTSLDTEELIYNFMKAYYGAGFEPMYEYFNIMRMRLYELEDAGVYRTILTDYMKVQHAKLFTKECFPKGFIDKCESLINEALALVDAENDAAARYAIEKDRMPLRYISLYVHKDSYEASVYTNMVRDFETFCNEMGCAQYSERGLMVSNLINSWLAN